MVGRRQGLSNAHIKAFLRWIASGILWLLRRVAGFFLAYAAIALTVLGVFRDPTENTTRQLLALLGLTIVMLARLIERVQRPIAVRKTLWADAELGTLFVACAFVLIELTGGSGGLLYPLVYALVAFLVTFHGLGLSAYFVALILGIEGAIMVAGYERVDLRLYVSHVSFVLLIGSLYAMFLRSVVFERRSSVEGEVRSHLDAIETAANDFRLTSGLSMESRDLTAGELQTRRRIGSVQAIQESLYNVLAVAERALEPFTVALLWMDADDKRMRVKELRSASDHIIEKPVAAREGLVGAITKRLEPVVLTNLKSGHPGLVYYARPQPISDFAGVPVLEGKHLRGVLVADRVDGRAFESADIEVMTTLAGEIVRAVQVEQVFADMDREKYQRDRFYEASRAFNQALTVEDVSQVAIDVTKRLARADFVAMAVAVPEQEGTLQLQVVDWPGGRGKELEGYTFAAEEGLAGAAIKARHPLPHGTARSLSQKMFGGDKDVPFEHVKVLPLLWKKTGVGALVLGSEQSDFLPLDLVDMLRVVADHAAIAIANAQMYERMQRMATTDGLTGLSNHRHFQELFDSFVARAERYGRQVSLILTDLDHFKSVNDTYGHPAGDQVLKRVSKLLQQNARKTDVVARYGGEEFAVLLDETGEEGAVRIASRIREMVEAEEFRLENGTFSCTLSLGVATYPIDARERAELVECSDRALYQAKGTGRNRVVTFSSIR